MKTKTERRAHSFKSSGCRSRSLTSTNLKEKPVYFILFLGHFKCSATASVKPLSDQNMRETITFVDHVLPSSAFFPVPAAAGAAHVELFILYSPVRVSVVASVQTQRERMVQQSLPGPRLVIVSLWTILKQLEPH